MEPQAGKAITLSERWIAVEGLPDPLYSCSQCGALVEQYRKHLDWHFELQQVVRDNLNLVPRAVENL